MRRFASFVAAVTFVSVALTVDATTPPEVMDVFAAHCTLCHDVEDPPKGLRLDTQRGVELAISRGIVRPGRPNATQLLTRLALPDDNALLMPPLDTPSRPNAAEIATLRAWVADLPPLPTPDDHADDAPASQAPAEDVERLQALGAHVGMLHLGTTWLRVDLTRVAFPLTTDNLDRLQAVGSWVREINLAGSDITEDLGAIIGACPHVRTIDASRTPLTSLGGVADATELVALNL
ncbi:MAG: c-type cytochrome domain-containing protein, partial [Candidatus Poribacteria bacterium]